MLFVVAATSASAAVASTSAPDSFGFMPNGRPLAQTFHDSGASWVATDAGAGCVSSRTIPIEDSLYIDRATGALKSFEDVRRSYAASAQLISEAPDGLQRLRVQFKYPLDRNEPVTLTAGGETFDLEPFRERSGDSVLITAPEIIAALRRADTAGGDATLVAVSADTKRLVVDAVAPPSFETLAACLAQGAPEDAETPIALITVSHDSAPTPDSVATLPEMRACGAEPDAGPLHRGALRSVTGFVSQTRDVYVRFSPDGSPRHLYIPGIFEAVREADGAWRADVSRAAAGNDPHAESTVSGCLGAATVWLCEDGAGGLGPCVGALLVGELPVENLLADAASRDVGAWSHTAPSTSGSTWPEFASPASMGGSGGWSSGARGTSAPPSVSSPRDPRLVTPAPDETVIPIPAPGALGMLVAAVAALATVGFRRQAARRSSSRIA
jgi:hypothetical protein